MKTFVTNKYLIEGLDRLGKDTLIKGIQNKRGVHQVLHYSKPERLDSYGGDLKTYQERSFRNMFSILSCATYAHVICNRAHLGECVYSPLYRKYDGDYVFELERDYGMHESTNVRLILLTENFSVSKHFVDDGLSFDISKRAEEQAMFVQAFDKSHIRDKRVICVTAPDGSFRPAGEILDEALAH